MTAWYRTFNSHILPLTWICVYRSSKQMLYDRIRIHQIWGI